MARGDEEENHLQLTEDQLDHLLRLNDYFNEIQQTNDSDIGQHNISNLLRLNDAVMRVRNRFPHLQRGQNQHLPESDSGANEFSRLPREDMPDSRGDNSLGIYANVEYSLANRNSPNRRGSGGNLSDDDNISHA